MTVGGQPALVAFASSTRIVVAVPEEVEAGPAPIRIEDLPGATAYVSVGGSWATGLHQVDNPVFDADGNLFVTYSGSRGQEFSGLDLSGDPGGHTRALRLRHRQRDVDGDWS